ncbi:phosphonate ABC transporter ATP-binding protein [Endozoicomonas sp. G2_2]|uniref:phosphonate ABC transporter ATP-binding protein n=1 Tax=Endozoicomonas sp. G2_2 TaxID=2821092 RepID=UPI001ADBF34B|nr:phosphonate ABC transporter ATP-binding protein [Endozoicomonas sp. G2_2]
MLRVEQLAVRFGGNITALHSTDLAFNTGELTVLLGPSGAGKSTLLRCLNRLHTPTSGRVVSQGLGALDSARKIRAHRAQTAMIFQQHQLLPRSSVLRNTLTARLGHHGFWRTLWPLSQDDRQLALESLERVDLLDKALVRADQLSGGQQQRVGIARALTQQAPLILADEPVASLDPHASRKVLSLLRNVCRERGLTAIVSLHQVEYTREFADRVVGLADGGVVFDGPVTQLCDDSLTRIYGSNAVTATAAQSRSAA